MTKPIPVFAFIFAAYAATSQGELARIPDRRRTKPDAESERERASVAFTSAWMLRPSAEGYLVKVALIGCVAAPGFRLAARSDALGATEDVWLGAISENLLGFVGVGVAGLETPAGQFVGKTIPFTRADVRDWRECASTAAVINWANRVRGDAATAATKSHNAALTEPAPNSMETPPAGTTLETAGRNLQDSN